MAKEQFPVDLSTGSITNMKDRIFREGIDTERFVWYPSTYNFDGTMTPAINGATPGSSGTFSGSVAGSGVAILTGTVGKGQIGWLSGFHLWCSSPVFFRMDFGLTKCGFQGPVGPTGLGQPVDKMLFPRDSLFTQLQGAVDNSSSNKVVATATQFLYLASADMDYDAPYIMEVLGDSNTVGPFAGEASQLWHWIVRKWYRDRGVRIRIVERAYGGKSTVHFEEYRGSRKLVNPYTANIVFYALGTNDQSTSSTILKDNLRKMINTKLEENPKCRFVIMGPMPKRGQETEMNAVRTAYSQVAAEYATANNHFVKFINCGGLFDPAPNTYYELPANDGTHFNAAGHALWGNAIIAGLQAIDNTNDVKFGTFK